MSKESTNNPFKDSIDLKMGSESNPIIEAGAKLKEARQTKKLSIEELAEKLRIGQEQLIALEKGQLDLLPEKVFIKAMIRRAAENLNLEINHLIKKIEVKSILAADKENKNNNSRNLLTKNILYTITTLILSIITIFSLLFLFNYNNEKNDKTSNKSNEYSALKYI